MPLTSRRKRAAEWLHVPPAHRGALLAGSRVPVLRRWV